MKELINVAIVGAGIGQEHLRAYLKLKNRFRVVCLCDTDRERAQRVLSEESLGEGSVEIETDLHSVVERSDIEIVDICLPPHLHFSTSVLALKAGKHVICEKPMVSSLREADELARVAAQSDRMVFPVFQYRYGPAIRKLKALIERGIAGNAFIASIETHWNRGSEYYANPWRGTWQGEQGGAVLGHAIHNHDLLCAILGPVRSLSAFGATRVNDIETEDCASIAFEMESGALATSSITLGSFTNTTRLKFCFENLTAESDLLPYSPASGDWSFDIRGTDPDQAEIDKILSGYANEPAGFTGFLEAVANRLQNGVQEHVTIEDGRHSIELVTAIYDSIRMGNRVNLPLSRSHPYYDGWLPD